ncbi:hypothetical protein EDB86DRAFT_3219430 [Lactarius hatsudake]|nr:hypothetical protein EDB86DRAFT_3219430 [Lactarius hatsudake]
MSQVPYTSTSSTDFGTIFEAALEAYNKQTKKDIASHPLAVQLQSCDSPSAILAILRAQTFPPAKAIFVGIGVLLQAVKDVRASQNTLVDLFGHMEYFFKRLEKYIDIRPTAAMTDIIVKIMVEVLSVLGLVTKEVRQGRTKKYLKKLVGRNDVEDALQRLDRLTQEEARMAAVEALMITRGIDDKMDGVNERVQCVDTKVEVIDNKVGSVTRRVEENGVAIQRVVNQVSGLNRNELRKDLRKWIAPPDPSVNYNAASRAHHAGTAAWCTKGNTLADWKTSGLLWIHGKPGSGKSILSSVLMRDIESLSNVGSAYMAYFFFDFKDTGKQDSRALSSSLLVQLSSQSEQFYNVLLELYSSHEDGSKQPTDNSLLRCLKHMLVIGQCRYISLWMLSTSALMIQAFRPPREMVLELVKELVELHHPNLRLCITSRPEFDIRTTLDPLATQQLSLHDESGQKEDIVDYVTFVVHSDKKMKRWRVDDKNMVIEKLTEKVDGMFRWAFCQLEVLRHCFPANLRRTLEELPKSLDETYKRILKDIDNANREHAFRLLQCLVVASRPLLVEELAEVVAFDTSTAGIPKVIADWRWKDREEAVLSACSSLVTVIVHRGSRVVQFSHFSVKEFLTSARLAGCPEEVTRFHIPIESSHMVLAQACLGALLCLNDHTEDEDEDEDSANKVPFVRYAAEYWVGHARVGNVEMRIKDAMDYFFDMDKPYFRAWVRIHDVDKSWGMPR